MREVLALARRIVEVVSDRQAVDILLLDIRELTTFADYFIVLSAETRRHMSALMREITREVKRLGWGSCRVEGNAEGGWILLDCGDLVVHIFHPRERDYYRLEEVWEEGRPVVRIQ